jgi:excinuclease ABC subunit A
VKQHPIILKNVKVHNLKGIDLTLQPNQLIVFSGVSGSGKSSLAFDTLYVEGQRRYIESLSTYARRQLGEMAKPDLESASGITPTISIEQKSASRNPRSTVGTLTEIYDYLRVLYARIGIPHCPVSGEPVSPQSRERIIRTVQTFQEGTKLIILAPFAKGKKGEFKEQFQDLLKKGYTRARVDGKILEIGEDITLDRNLSHDIDVVIDRIQVSPGSFSRIAESVTAALTFGNGVMSVYAPDTDEETLFSMHAFSVKSGLSYEPLEPHDFSFNSPKGMCPTCLGLGVVQEFDLELVIDPEKSIAEDCCSVGSSYQTVRFGNIYNNLAAIYGFSVKTPWKKLKEAAKHVFLYGTEKKWTRMDFVHPVTGQEWTDHVHWRGVLYEAKTRFTEATSDGYRSKMLKLMREQCCPDCKGERLKAYPRAATVGGKRIAEVSFMTTEHALKFFQSLKLSDLENQIAVELLKEIKQRLIFLIDVGLNYLTLDRTAPTLSGGEAQRVRLASQIGCGLVGITYILDEPSIGLHPRDNKKLLQTLLTLRDKGNTVIVVEHDEETILAADHIVDFGPGAGVKGGEILVNGSLDDLINSKESLTGAYLTGRKSIPVPKKRRKKSKLALKIKGATHHNLKNLNADIPLGLFVAVTGISGSGKSSLISDILYPVLSNTLHRGEHAVGAHDTIEGIDNLDKVIAIDQSPIGRNPRSNPATYVKLFDDIRLLFSKLPESQALGYLPGRFSFNVKEGSCQECGGMGMIKIDMDFLEEEWVECPVCHNRRFDEETLSVLYKGKNIHEILEMDIESAYHLFEPIPTIKNKLEMLRKVGLNYLKLGQSSTTLSGGEAQRIKLAKELLKPATGKTLYILDEPTTGLHFHDISHLLEVLHHFVERGNSVLVIEHNMDVVKTADWVIDLGPEGGEGGGKIVAEGTPEKIASLNTPTSTALREVLELTPAERLALYRQHTHLYTTSKPLEEIVIQDAEQNNLKRVSVTIPREKITICTGPSGSGKSSLAFDTVYAEGQRRYIESLSPYARQFVKQMDKPKVGFVEGLSPAIAIEQTAHSGNPRSTVGTLTEVYDYLRILFARLGIPHSPDTKEVIRTISKDYVVERILELPKDTKIQILSTIEIKKQDRFEDLIGKLKKQGYVRIRLNGTYYDLDSPLEDFAYDRKRKNALFLVIDRLKVNPSITLRLSEAVQNAATLSKNKVVVALDDKDIFFNLAFAVESTGASYPEITPQTFAFNKAEGMCPECQGLGITYGANLLHKPWVLQMSLSHLCHILMGDSISISFTRSLMNWFESINVDPYTPLQDLSPKALKIIMDGSQDKTLAHASSTLYWIGLNAAFEKIGKSAHTEYKEGILPLLDEQTCLSCNGERLNPLARHVTINDRSIGDVCRMPAEDALTFFSGIKLPKSEKTLEDVLKQIVERLKFMCDVGIHYIALDRRAPTLSGGETQRIRLARQLGSGLNGVLYVLDEPTIGLHPRDNEKLKIALLKLKTLGNTLLIVEHDPMMIKMADKILDFGPESGAHGGHITASGTYQEILKNPHSLTGAYLSGRKKIEIAKKPRKERSESIEIAHAKEHNLKDLSLKIPVGKMTCITGVSGSGKSTLLYDVIAPCASIAINNRKDKAEFKAALVSGLSVFDRLISVDQKPIGLTSRSDVSTYVDVWGPIREFYASLPLAKTRGLQPKNFSYNHLKGMCTACFGMGYKKIEMHFLPTVRTLCEDCQGMRLNPVSLEVHYQGKSAGKLLECTIDEARIIFENHPKICRILDTLISVGLGYLRLGQEMASLSGGEAQRIKLSRELAKRSSGKTLYLLDEPTTGLHSEDIVKLLTVLNRLIEKGNTVILVEHNLDMMRHSDHLIDLGPEGGELGGYIVCQGTPAEIIKVKKSQTAKYLEGVYKV